MSWIVSYLPWDCNKHSPQPKKLKSRRPGSSDLRVKKCLILPLTRPRHCNGTSPPQLKIAHNQSTGRHISVLLKRINVQCREQIDGWQDSKSINMDVRFGITSARHRPILISCAFVQWAAQHSACWKKYLPVEQGLWRTTQIKCSDGMYNFEIILFYSSITIFCCLMLSLNYILEENTFESTMKWYVLEPDKN